jgi:signal peptidase I
VVTPLCQAGLAACAVTVPVAVAVVLVRRRFVMVTVRGPSMLPTLKAGDRVLVRRTEVGKLRRGQLAVAGENGRSADGSQEWVIKRVAAVPGDPRPACLPDTADPAGRVPDGHYVLLGDNAAVSYDSRERGYFTAGQLLGVVVRGYARRAT